MRAGEDWQELGERPVRVMASVPVPIAVREERDGWAARVEIGLATITCRAATRERAIRSAESAAAAALGRFLRAG